MSIKQDYLNPKFTERKTGKSFVNKLPLKYKLKFPFSSFTW